MRFCGGSAQCKLRQRVKQLACRRSACALLRALDTQPWTSRWQARTRRRRWRPVSVAAAAPQCVLPQPGQPSALSCLPRGRESQQRTSMMPARADGVAAKEAPKKGTRRPLLIPWTAVLTRAPAGQTPPLLRPSTPAALAAAQHRPRCSLSASRTSKAWALAPRLRGQSTTLTPPEWPPPTARRCGWPLRRHGNKAAALPPLRPRRLLPLLRLSSTPEPHLMRPRRHIARLLWRRCGRRGCLCTGM